MNKFRSFFLLMAILLSACTPAVIPPTSTPIPTSTQQATLTPTIEPTITPSPTPTEIPFVSFAQTVDDCTTEQTANRGYTSWADLLTGELTGPAYTSKEVWAWGVPYGMVLVRAKVLEITKVPVTTEYWIAQSVSHAHLLCVAFPKSPTAGMVLAGFTMNDGTYVPMITHLNGGDPTGNTSDDDVALPSITSLNQLVNGLYYMRVATYHGIDQGRIMTIWGEITTQKDSSVSYSDTLYQDEIVRRGKLGEELWIANWNAESGYVRASLPHRVASIHQPGVNSADFELEPVWIIRFLNGEYSEDFSSLKLRDPLEDAWMLVDKLGTDEFGTSAAPNAFR